MFHFHRSHKLLTCCLLALLLLALGAMRGTVAEATALMQKPSAAHVAPAYISAGAQVRSGPGDRYLLLAVVEGGEDHAILGRSSDGRWWRVDYRGQAAWVLAAQVQTAATNVPVVRVGGERL